MSASIITVPKCTIWTKYTTLYTAAQTAALTNTITMVTLPAQTILMSSVMRQSVSFTGTGITACTALVSGYGQTLNGSLNILQASSGTSFLAIDNRTSGGMILGSDLSTTKAITLLFTAVGVGHTLNDLSQGSLDVWLETYTLV